MTPRMQKLIDVLRSLPESEQDRMAGFLEYLLNERTDLSGGTTAGAKPDRVLGSAKGRIKISDDFDAPLG